VSEQRKTKRFEIQLPLELVRTGSEPVSRAGETRNMSSGGVLFTSEAEMPVGDPIEYLVTLPSALSGAQVRLRCMGKVIRSQGMQTSEPAMARRPFAIAATLERYEFIRSK
jgi:hypothetical protein